MSGVCHVWNSLCLEFVVCGITLCLEICCTYVRGGLMYIAIAEDSASHSSDVWVETVAAAVGGH